MNLSAEMLAALERLCRRDELEVDAQLIEDTIDLLIEDRPLEDPEAKLEFIQALRRVSRHFKNILKAITDEKG